MRKSPLPWARLIAEFVVIAVGVLSALAADAWWEERTARQDARDMLAALHQELVANEEILAVNTDWQERWLAQVNVLLEEAAADGPSLPTDSVDHLLASLPGWTIPVYERGALEASLAGDRLRSLDDETLRESIAEWGTALDQLTEVESNQAFVQRWFDFLHANTYMPQIWNVGAERVEGWQNSTMPARSTIDYGPVLQSRAFANLLVERRMVSEDVLFFYARLRSALDSLRVGIEAELAR